MTVFGEIEPLPAGCQPTRDLRTELPDARLNDINGVWTSARGHRPEGYHDPENEPDLFGVFPDRSAPVVALNADGTPEWREMRWGFPPPKAGLRPVTNVRNTSSSFWRTFLKPEWRVVVPFYNPGPYLAPLLDSRRYVESSVAGIKIKAHPLFRLVATMNEDSSTFDLPEYIHSRLQPQILIDFPERIEELAILRENKIRSLNA